MGGIAGSAGAGAQTSWDTCEHPGDCALFAKNCCGSYCSAEPLTSWLAINSSLYSHVSAALCGSGPINCTDCIPYNEPNYLAVCRNSKCVAVDVRKDELSACTSAADCRLRWGADCCESCSGFTEELIAVSATASLECSPFAGACPPCMPQPYPTDAKADCLSGHCAVVWAAMPGG